jgi:ankyrin repeat protein
MLNKRMVMLGVLFLAVSNCIAMNPRADQALLEAATIGDVKAMEAALAQGANPNATHGFRITALMEAITSTNPNAVEILLKRNADVNHVCGDGWTPLYMAVMTRNKILVSMLMEYDAKIDDNLMDAMRDDKAKRELVKSSMKTALEKRQKRIDESQKKLDAFKAAHSTSK